MTYIEFLRKKYEKANTYDLLELTLLSEKLKNSSNEGEKYLGMNYSIAINWILKAKDLKFLKAYGELKRVLYGQKRIY